MYFTKIRLNGLVVIDLPLVDAKLSDRYILKSVDGLGPPEVDVSIADTLNAGGVYQGRRPQNREIVGLVGLNPDYLINQTVSDLRSMMYGLLTPGYEDYVTVQIMNEDAVLVQATGYVSKFEINPFSKDPEVQVTIACLKQYLEAPGQLFVSPESKAAPEIDNIGSAPAGFHMEFIFSNSVTNFVLDDPSGKKMELTYEFLTGDKLTIDTRPGSRGIWLERVGAVSNIIYALSADSVWYMLHGGVNTFTTSSQKFVWGDVYYLPQYWGI